MANERKLLALTDAQLRALKSLIRTEIVRTRPKKPKKKWLVPGGAGGTSALPTLAKMISTAPAACWVRAFGSSDCKDGFEPSDEMTMGQGQAHLYEEESGGTIRLAVPPSGLSDQQLSDWEAKYKPIVYNPDGAYPIRNGALVTIGAVSSGNGGTRYTAKYFRPIDYLYALPGFGGKNVLAVPENGSEPDDIQWMGEECQ